MSTCPTQLFICVSWEEAEKSKLKEFARHISDIWTYF